MRCEPGLAPSVRRVHIAIALFIAALLVGAGGAFVEGCGANTCVRHSDCSNGMVCGPNGVCVVPTAVVDGGAPSEGGVFDLATSSDLTPTPDLYADGSADLVSNDGPGDGSSGDLTGDLAMSDAPVDGSVADLTADLTIEGGTDGGMDLQTIEAGADMAGDMAGDMAAGDLTSDSATDLIADGASTDGGVDVGIVGVDGAADASGDSATNDGAIVDGAQDQGG